MNRASRSRLHPGCHPLFPSQSMRDRVARAACDARCLARRELFESWSFVDRARPHIDADVVWDLGAGHGLVGMILALLEPGLREVRLVDRRKPPSYEKLRAALDPLAPERLARVVYEERRLDDLAPPAGRAFIVAVHACGKRTDEAIDLALASRSSVALLPCCHDASIYPLPGAITGRWSKRDAVDLARIFRLDAAGYRTYSRRIEDGLTHCADAIIGVAPAPGAGPAPVAGGASLAHPPGAPGSCQALPRYSWVDVETRSLSPTFTKPGTFTTIPLSQTASLSWLEPAAELVGGADSVTVKTMDGGSSRPAGSSSMMSMR